MKLAELKKTIADTLVVGGGVSITESYVALPKKFPLAGESSSNETKRLHVDLYEEAIKKFNRTSAELDAVNLADSSVYKKFRHLKTDEVALHNKIYLHELYFSNSYDPESEIAIESLVYMRLQRDWGSFERFQHDFIACAMSSRLGWAITGFSAYLQRYHTVVVDNDDSSIPVGFFPIIVQDTHEHAFINDYKNDKMTYLIEQMKQWNWSVIDERVQRAEFIAEAVR